MKNANHRKQIQEAASNPVSLPGRPHTTTLPQSFIDEALLLSDLLDLNEFSSVDLLVAGEQQQPRYPGWSRGLVAVILYHDGRRVFLQCLDALVQARRGRNWQVGVSDELSTLATNFTDGLIKVSWEIAASPITTTIFTAQLLRLLWYLGLCPVPD